jgi:hypothetical protein
MVWSWLMVPARNRSNDPDLPPLLRQGHLVGKPHLTRQ